MTPTSSTRHYRLLQRFIPCILAVLLLQLVSCTSAEMGPPAIPEVSLEQTTSEAHTEVVQSTKRFRKEYLLSPGDLLGITVLRRTDMNLTSRIRPDGYISVPYIDEVKASGLTVKELNQQITGMLSKRLVNPEVSISVLESRPAVVYVTGEVKATTVVPVADAPTAMQAIIRAGGFTTKSAKDSVVIIRVAEDGQLNAFRLNLGQSLPESPYIALRNMPVAADDIIYVPMSYVGRVSTFIAENFNIILDGLTKLPGVYTSYRLLPSVDDQADYIEKVNKSYTPANQPPNPNPSSP